MAACTYSSWLAPAASARPHGESAKATSSTINSTAEIYEPYKLGVRTLYTEIIILILKNTSFKAVHMP
jgi:hypothetical protein